MQANMKPRFRSEKNCLNCHLTQFACRDLGATCIGKGCQSATPKCRQIWTPRFKVKKLHQNLGANCMEGCQSAPNAGKCRFKTEKIASKSHTVILEPLACQSAYPKWWEQAQMLVCNKWRWQGTANMGEIPSDLANPHTHRISPFSWGMKQKRDWGRSTLIILWESNLESWISDIHSI